MTQCIIDLFEAIKVEVHQRDLVALLLRFTDHRRYLVEKEPPVGKTGQAIEVGLIEELVFCNAAARNVAYRKDSRARRFAPFESMDARLVAAPRPRPGVTLRVAWMIWFVTGYHYCANADEGDEP